MSSNLCPTCGVALDHHGTGCQFYPPTITRFVGEQGPQLEVVPFITRNTITITKLVGVPFCPDLLNIDDMGEADGWRGQVVRGFFHALKVVDRWLP